MVVVVAAAWQQLEISFALRQSIRHYVYHHRQQLLLLQLFPRPRDIHHLVSVSFVGHHRVVHK